MHHNESEMDEDTISANTGEAIAAPENTSADDPRKTNISLQISSDKRKNDNRLALCKVDECEKYPQREKDKVLADAGVHVQNEVVGSSSVAAPTSSRKRERTNNDPIANLLSRQVLSLVPNIKIPEQVNMFILTIHVNSKR